MKIRSLIVLVIIAIAFGACKKDTNSKKQIKLLVKANYTTFNNTTSNTYIYDDRNRLIEVRGRDQRTYEYDGDDLVGYKTKLVSRVTTYNNGVPVSSVHTDLGTGRKTTTTYVVSNGRVVRSVRASTPVITTDLTYSGDNLASYKDHISTYVYSYGPDKPPLYNARLKYILDLDDIDFFSANGLIEMYFQLYPFRGITYSYLRDNDGFPKSAVEKRNNPLDPDNYIYTDITYEYEMRDVAQ